MSGSTNGLVRAPSSSVTAPAPEPKKPDPGKATMVQPHPTGNAGVDQGGACVTATGCGLLNDHQRTMLVVATEGRVNAALASFLRALGDLHMETYVKQPAQMPWYASMLLDAALGVVGAGVIGAVMKLARGGPEVVEALAEAGAHNISVAAAQTSIVNLEVKQVEGLLKKAMDAGKKGATKTISGAAVADNANEKAQSLNFVDYMSDSAMTSFQQVREDAAAASDIALLAIFRAYEASRCTPSMYRAKAKAMLERYKASHASEIGRRDGQSDARPPPVDGGNFKLETRVAWLIVGGGKRLIYVDRAFEQAAVDPSKTDPDNLHKPGPAYQGQHALSLQDNADWTNGDPKAARRMHAAPVGLETMLGFVEEEFVDVALQQQETMWLAQPETFTMNYDTNPPHISKVVR